MKIEIKLDKDEVRTLIENHLRSLFPKNKFAIYTERYGAGGWECNSIEEVEPAPIPAPPPVDLGKLMAGDFDETVKAAKIAQIADDPQF